MQLYRTKTNKNFHANIHIRNPGKITPIIWCTANCSSICAFGVNKLKFYAVPRHFELVLVFEKRTNRVTQRRVRNIATHDAISASTQFFLTLKFCVASIVVATFALRKPGRGLVTLLYYSVHSIAPAGCKPGLRAARRAFWYKRHCCPGKKYHWISRIRPNYTLIY